MHVHCSCWVNMAAFVLALPTIGNGAEQSQPRRPGREGRRRDSRRGGSVRQPWRGDTEAIAVSGHPMPTTSTSQDRVQDPRGLERASECRKREVTCACCRRNFHAFDSYGNARLAIGRRGFERNSAEPGHSPHGRYTRVVKRDGKWLIDRRARITGPARNQCRWRSSLSPGMIGD